MTNQKGYEPKPTRKKSKPDSGLTAKGTDTGISGKGTHKVDPRHKKPGKVKG